MCRGARVPDGRLGAGAMIDKPVNLWCATRTDGVVRVEYVLFLPQPNGIGIILFGIVEGELRQVIGKLQRETI